MTSLLPWQQQQWQSLVARLRQDSLPHALVLTGPAGLGKRAFALRFVQLLLCERTDGVDEPCNTCHGCHLFFAGNHPDIKLIEPAEPGKAILVDQIREVIDYVALKPHYARLKITVIAPAEQMNVAASNSLLKSLEEPPDGSMMLLVSHRPAGLLPTIRSRCQRVEFSKPPRKAALDWLTTQGRELDESEALLALAEGAPLAALEFGATDVLTRRREAFADFEKLSLGREDVVTVAGRWLNSGVREPLDWLASWTTDMIRLKAASQPPYLANPDLLQGLRRLADGTENVVLHRFFAQVTDAVRLAATPVNDQLALEDVLIEWCRTHTR